MQIKQQNIPLIVIPLVLIIDQASKIWVKTNMSLGESIQIAGNWFVIHFTENYGMAFGLEFGGEYGKVFLSLFRVFAIIFISWYLFGLVKKKSNKLLIVCISLILAGAIGNMIDSAFYGLLFSESYFTVAQFMPEGGGYGAFLHGKVVDMIYLPVINTTLPEWFPIRGGERFVFFKPVFNIADMAITIGALTLIVFHKRVFSDEKLKGDNQNTHPKNT